MEIIVNSAVTITGIIVCYVLGYRKAVKQSKNIKPLPTSKCVCSHKATSHYFNSELREWGACRAINKDRYTCACTHYVEDLSNV